MGVELIDVGLDLMEYDGEGLAEERERQIAASEVDSRRRLERRLDELKLAKELRDYDYDYDLDD